MERYVGNWNQRKDLEDREKYYKMRISAMMLDEQLSKYVDIFQGVAQGCALSPTIFKAFHL